MTNDIFKLKLHKVITVGQWDILRVPGGWIYTHSNYNEITYDYKQGSETVMSTHSIFVPYSDAVKRELLEEVVCK